jgi:hypothetical protein
VNEPRKMSPARRRQSVVYSLTALVLMLALMVFLAHRDAKRADETVSINRLQTAELIHTELAKRRSAMQKLLTFVDEDKTYGGLIHPLKLRLPYPSAEELVGAIKTTGIEPGWRSQREIRWYPAGASIDADLDGDGRLRTLLIGMALWSPSTEAIAASGPSGSAPALLDRLYPKDSMQVQEQRNVLIGRSGRDYLCGPKASIRAHEQGFGSYPGARGYPNFWIPKWNEAEMNLCQ